MTPIVRTDTVVLGYPVLESTTRLQAVEVLRDSLQYSLAEDRQDGSTAKEYWRRCCRGLPLRRYPSFRVRGCFLSSTSLAAARWHLQFLVLHVPCFPVPLFLTTAAENTCVRRNLTRTNGPVCGDSSCTKRQLTNEELLSVLGGRRACRNSSRSRRGLAHSCLRRTLDALYLNLSSSRRVGRTPPLRERTHYQKPRALNTRAPKVGRLADGKTVLLFGTVC